MTVTRLADHLVGGTHAARPAATAVPVGTLYSCSDHSLIYQSDGSTWSTYADLTAAASLALDGLSDVATSGAATGNVLEYNGSSWAPAAPVTALNDLSDATITSATAGDALIYSGSAWVNQPAATGFDVVANFDDYFNLTTGSYDYEFHAADTTSLPGSWSWVNQGGSDYREVGGRARLYADGAGGSTSANECHRMIVRALPSESTWTAVLKMPSMACYPSQYFRGGLVLRDSAGGDYVTWGRRVTNNGLPTTVSLDYWSSLNTIGTAIAASYMADTQSFFRVKKNSATSFDFASSADGIAWQTFWSGYDPTADGLSLDEIGIVGSCPSGSSCVVGLDWFRVRV